MKITLSLTEWSEGNTTATCVRKISMRWFQPLTHWSVTNVAKDSLS